MTYKKSQPLSGRIDGTSSDAARFHQMIKHIDLEKESPAPKSFAFIGSKSDEGVRRNLGRIGAKEGPDSIRYALSNLPVHFDSTLSLLDCGDVSDENGDLEKMQHELGSYITKILQQGATPIILGGGHDISYSNYLGIKNFTNKKIGIINFDAHFDLRPVDPAIGNSSGTSIYAIANQAQKNNEHFSCLALGIQKYANTKLLFDLAEKFQVDYVLGDDFTTKNQENILKKTADFIAKNDVIYLTICMDVFAACYAPGVSAPSLNGIIPNEVFRSVFDLIISSKKTISYDFAETNPKFDIDFRTAKLAAGLIFRILN